MNPVSFPESNATLGKPAGWSDEECGPLPVLRYDDKCISCWAMTWKERFSALFFGKVWLRVWSGETQPPVSLEVIRTIFIKPRKKAE